MDLKEDFHASFSASTFAEKVSWMNILEDYNAEEEFVRKNHDFCI